MNKTNKTSGGHNSKRAIFYAPWKCEERGGQCEIAAYVKADGKWKTLAVIAASPAAKTDIARLTELVNEKPHEDYVLRAAFGALKAVMDEGFTFATEMELDHAIKQLQRYAV